MHCRINRRTHLLIAAIFGLVMATLFVASVRLPTPRLEAAPAPRGEGFIPPTDASAAPSSTARVSGAVADAQTGQALQGARVALAPLAVPPVLSDAAGHFRLDDIPIAGPYAIVTVTVTAPGYGVWVMRDLALYPGVELLLDVQPGRRDRTIDVGLPGALGAGRKTIQEPATGPRLAGTPVSNDNAPATIKVAVTPYADCGAWLNNGKPVLYVEEVPFKDYVRNVLPNEWVPSWGTTAPDSLRAGAIAVKMFAWWRMRYGRPEQGADVVDNTCDQRYIKGVHYDWTDRAVEDTWNYRMRDGGQVVEIHYLSTAAYCSPYPRCMPQWGTYYDALAGMKWPAIVHKYYDPVTLDGVAARAAWTATGAGVKEANFVLGEGIQYVAEVWNIASVPQAAAFTWSASDTCGETATLWSGNLTTPPGYWWWILSGNVPASACLGSWTYAHAVTFSGMEHSSGGVYLVARPAVCTSAAARQSCITATPTAAGTPTATPPGWVATPTFTPTPFGPPLSIPAPDFFWSFLPLLRK